MRTVDHGALELEHRGARVGLEQLHEFPGALKFFVAGLEGAVDDFRDEVENRLEAMKHQADVVRKQASDNWDKLEKIFEDRVGRALSGLGIPGSDATPASGV